MSVFIAEWGPTQWNLVTCSQRDCQLLATVLRSSQSRFKNSAFCSTLHFIFWMYVPRSPGCPHLPDLKTVRPSHSSEAKTMHSAARWVLFLDVRPQIAGVSSSSRFKNGAAIAFFRGENNAFCSMLRFILRMYVPN